MTAHEVLECLVQSFIDHIDSCKDGNRPVRIDFWYERLNKGLDSINRERSGIPPQVGIGRPIGSKDKCKRKAKMFGKLPDHRR